MVPNLTARRDYSRNRVTEIEEQTRMLGSPPTTIASMERRKNPSRMGRKKNCILRNYYSYPPECTESPGIGLLKITYKIITSILSKILKHHVVRIITNVTSSQIENI